jgi:hypothetical protein
MQIDARTTLIEANTIIVDGKLTVDPTHPGLTIRAHWIWIKDGSFSIGSLAQPH